MRKVRKQAGFTLIEIIAVLVILGILAAVAVPKYLDMADDARQKSAQAAIAEVKGRLSTAQAKWMMTNGNAPTSQQLFTFATTDANAFGTQANLENVGTDYTVSVSAGPPISISISTVQGVNLKTSVIGNFRAAGDP